MNRISAFILLAMLMSGSMSHAQTRPATQQGFEVTDLFEAGEKGYTTFRIPSIAITSKGAILVACAARANGWDDWTDIDTAMRRSTDGGKTWEPMRIINDAGKLPAENATFIVDGERVLLMYHINYAKAYLRSSDDDGATWSEPTEITSVFDVYRTRDKYNWQVLAMGPGHGIVLKSGRISGRIIVPIWLSTTHKHRPSITSTVYSDDHGKTWQAGAVVTQNLAESRNPSENVCIELADGRVMDNIRCESPAHRRLEACSEDGATSWSKPAPDDQLFEPVCMASMIRYSRAGDASRGSKDRILFCNPDSEHADTLGNKAGNYVRKNLTLRLSYDEGKTWPVAKVIDPGESGYSDLAVAQDGTIFLAYENGSTNGEKVFSSKYLSIARIGLSWLTDGKDSGK